MSEMDFEDAPAVHEPLLRPWLRRELLAWTRGCYPRRRGITIVIGWLFILPWAAWLLLKAFIWLAGVVCLLAAWPFWAVAELFTYQHRLKRTALRAWGPYVAEQIEPPPEAA